MLPVLVGFAVLGVQVKVRPETQYVYRDWPSTVTTLPDALKVPRVLGSGETTPSPPACTAVAQHRQPPSGASAQLAAL